MTDMKHVAHLTNGGTIEITLPLVPFPYANVLPKSWRRDANGVLLNLDYVAAISGGTAKPKVLVAIEDGVGDIWTLDLGGPNDDGESVYRIKDAAPGTTYATRWQIGARFGIRNEIWE